jgi:hypothetical protein
MALERAGTRFGSQPMVYGDVEIERSAGGGLPYEVVHGGTVAAGVGWYGWLSIFLGGGQRLDLADGTRWRLQAMGWRSYISPVIVDVTGGKVAFATPGHGNYTINGKAWAFVLNPDDPAGRGRSKRWTLRERDTEVASLTRKPRAATCWEPTPLAAVLLGLVVAQMGIPGENEIRLPPMYR